MPHKILLVEDDKSIQEAMKYVLEGEGYELVLADHGQEALKLLQSTPHPALIILDIMMPVMNGVEFRAAQLRDSKLASIPTIALSADRTFLHKGQEQFQGVLKKPVALEDLLHVIEKICH